MTFTAWNILVCDNVRPFFVKLFPETDGLLYLINCHEPHLLQTTKEVSGWNMQGDIFPDVPLLLLCIKDDQQTDCCTTDHVIDAMGLRFSNVQFRAVNCSSVTGEEMEEGMEWFCQELFDRGSPRREQRQWLHRVWQPAKPSVRRVFLTYDPTYDGGNKTLQRFAPIRFSTKCPFAKSAILWGGVTLPDNCGSQEDQARANVDGLTVFAAKSRQGEPLDGFCIETR